VQAAYDIARFTAEDPMAGLPDADDIAPPDTHRDLDLFHPWAIDSEQAAQPGLECEAAALATSKRITNSEGAGVSAQQSHFFSAHTRTAFAAAMPARATACRCHPSPIARARGEHAARCLVQLHARRGRRTGLARGRGPLCRRAR
jgi:hypothetical protein